MNKFFLGLFLILSCSMLLKLSSCAITKEVDPEAIKLGESVYEHKCKVCHSVRDINLVGPSLYRITKKRSHEWVERFVRDSQGMIADGDVDAVSVFKEYNEIPMPSFPESGLSKKEMSALLAFFDSL